MILNNNFYNSMNNFGNNIYFAGYKSSKYMEKSYTTNSLLNPETQPDNLPEDLDLEDQNVVYNYSRNRLKKLYDYYGFSSDKIKPTTKKKLENNLNLLLTRLQSSNLDSSNLDMIVRLIEDKKLSLGLIRSINEHFEVSRNVSSDLDKLYEAYIERKSVEDVFVPKFENIEAAKDSIETGDVCQIADDENISVKTPDGKIKKLFITPETYLELFPPVERFIVSQNNLGDCYILSSINSINQNPNSRHRILEMFRQNPDDTVDVVFGGFQYENGENGKILPKKSDEPILENIAEIIPKHRSKCAVSSTAEGVRAIELLIELLEHKRDNYLTQELYKDFKENGEDSAITLIRPYNKAEIEHFISYIDENGLDSMFTLQDLKSLEKFTLSKEEILQALEKAKQNDDEISKYEVLILERWLKVINAANTAEYDIFGETLPKEIVVDLFKDVKPINFYYINGGGHSYNVLELFGLDVIKKDEKPCQIKEELFSQDPKKYVFTCATTNKKAEKSNGRFLSNHAYSLEPVDVENERKFAIKNPHNSMEEIILTYDELCKYFDKISVAKA